MKVIVYTTIFGGSDSLKPAPGGAQCVCFVDDPGAYPDTNGWELSQHTYSGDPRREAWSMRCLAHRLFPSYDRVIWIDASFTLTNLPKLLRDAGSEPIAALRHHRRHSCYTEAREIVSIAQADRADVERQMHAYKRAGFAPNHLSISCVIVRNRSDQVAAFNATWDEQIRTYPGDNTQLSLDYSAWVNGLEIAPLKGSRHSNGYAEHDHDDHKRRRKPYAREAAA